MRILSVFLFFLYLVTYSCSPKTTSPVMSQEAETKASEVVTAPAKQMEVKDAAMPAVSNDDMTSPKIPVDERLTMGKLENGIHYYIQKNVKPENRAELRLAVNAGSILEDPDQLGLAHFVEHMAFNGTENFEKSELVDYLESVGTRFGPDLNAYTSFDETVYMLQVRTDSAAPVSYTHLTLPTTPYV